MKYISDIMIEINIPLIEKRKTKNSVEKNIKKENKIIIKNKIFKTEIEFFKITIA